MSATKNYNNESPFIIEKILNAPQALVWKAITDKELMKQWYSDLAEFKAEPGFEFRFVGGPPEGKQWMHICVIKEVVPGSKLVHSWKYEGYPGDSLVTFELTSVDTNKTKLRLTHAGLDTFPASEPDLYKNNFEKGWTEIIGTSLAAFLSKLWE
jgi:uncharacterized protein YndB with AHSA1/START domain